MSTFLKVLYFYYLEIGNVKPYYAKTKGTHKELIMNRKLKLHIWFVDAREVGTIWYGLCLSANDLAKIGLLCLNKGKYNGKQIISENYIDEMIKKQKLKMVILGECHMYYYGRLLILKKIYTAMGNSANIYK